MATYVQVTKVERTKLRKLPFLPRYTVAIEIAGRQLTFRTTPMLETIVNLRDKGYSWSALRKLVHDEVSELTLPKIGRGLAVVKELTAKNPALQDAAGKVLDRAAAVAETVARGVSKIKGSHDTNARAVKKPAAKAAASRRKSARSAGSRNAKDSATDES